LTAGVTLAPRPVWIVEGRTEDPYNSFGAIILYVDREMYRTYWKLVYNRRGEYFYNAMCAYQWSAAPDGAFAAVTPALFIGVGDSEDEAVMARLRKQSFVDRGPPGDRFTLHFLVSRSD
jgi:hypothetical protein